MRHLIAAAFSLLPGIASAHAILIDSQPAAGASIHPGQTQIVIRYNSRIDHARSRLTLVGSNAEMVLPEAPDSPVDSLATQKVLLTPGRYTVHWQVLAADGHITRGDLPFTVSGH